MTAPDSQTVAVILIDSLAEGKLTIADSAFSVCSIVVF